MRSLLALVVLACCGTAASAADIRTGMYQGRKVTFENVNGEAIYQGDIILGRTADIEGGTAGQSAMRRRSVGVAQSNTWPNGVIPYTLDTALSDALKNRIQQAIDHWNTKTPVKWQARAGESSYVTFTTSTSTVACSSNVGMTGRQQFIHLPDGCGLGPIIHEMGHAVGLWHEQTRSDRNRFISVMYENIDQPSAFNYDLEYFGDGVDRGPYDFNSIMHYGATDFSRDGLSLAMESVPPGIPLGQRTGLSAGDIDAVQRMYNQPATATTIATAPSGLTVWVDGSPVADGTTFNWPPGETHTIEARQQLDPNSSSIRYNPASWSDGGDASHVFTAAADKTVVIANYARQYKLSTGLNPPGSGTITIEPASPDGWYNDRANLFITATPNSGYNFVSWAVTPRRSMNPKWIIVRSSTGPIAANFSKSPVTMITSTPPGVLVRVDDNQYTTPAGFVWTAGDPHTVTFDDANDQPDFVHYKFDSWSDGGAQTHTVTAAAEGGTLSAKFITQHEFEARSLSGGGTTSLTPALGSAGQCAGSSSTSCGFFDEGTQVQVVGDAGGSRVLRSWYGDLGGNTSPATVLVDGQKTVIGVFGSQLPFTVVSAATNSDGLLAPGASQTSDYGWVAPGQIVAIYSSNQIGPANGQPGQIVNGAVANSLAGVQVFFNRLNQTTGAIIPGSAVAAPILYAKSDQINCIVPYSMPVGDTVGVTISNNGQTFGPVFYDVAQSAPGIFTADQSGRGAGAIQNEDYTLNTAANPVQRGKVIVIYATGEGATVPAVADGTVNSTVFPKAALPVSVRIGGQPAKIEYAGALPTGVAGAFQINARVPLGVAPGPKVPVSVVIGDQASAVAVTVAVR